MDSTKLCQICHLQEFKYTCPKCNTLYCSVDCYRALGHQQCSESFYRDCVTEEMTFRGSNSRDPANIEEVRKMYEVLQKMQNNIVSEGEDGDEIAGDGFGVSMAENDGLDSDDDEDEDDLDLATRLDGIDLDNPDAVWNCLTASERHDFESLLKTGDINKIIPTFEPWWEIKIHKKLIQDLDAVTKDKSEELKHPKLLDNITPFSTIMKKSPSPCLPNNLYNIISAYTLIVRFFNGDHHQSCLLAVQYLIECSATLKNNANFDDTEQAVKSVIAECSNSAIVPSAWQVVAYDVEKIVEGPFEGKRDPVYVKAALSDMHCLLVAAKQNATKGTATENKFLEKKTITAVLKKIEFFLSFVHEAKVE